MQLLSLLLIEARICTSTPTSKNAHGSGITRYGVNKFSVQNAASPVGLSLSPSQDSEQCHDGFSGGPATRDFPE